MGQAIEGGDTNLNERALRQFRELVRFVAVESGQSIEGLLLGKFREILHAVLRAEFRQSYEESEVARRTYQKSLEDGLLAPMRDRVLEVSRRIFPELTGLSLVPAVSSLDDTLSDIDIRMRDSVETALNGKGTGVAGGVLVALLRYLNEATKQSVVFALEEPETFLHPAAQQDLRQDLEALAVRPDVTLLVTTHSPFIVSRSESSQVVALAKNSSGESSVVDTAAGSDSQASVLSGLFVDSTVPELLDVYYSVPPQAKVILLLEGSTDVQFLRLAMDVLGYSERLQSIHMIASRGAYSLVAQAILLRAASQQPVWVLLDSDEPGKKARDLLRERFGFDKRDIFEYSKFLGNADGAESEWLFPAELMQRFVDSEGEERVLKSKSRLGGEYRYDFTPPGKELFPMWLKKNASRSDLARWEEVLRALSKKLNEIGQV